MIGAETCSCRLCYQTSTVELPLSPSARSGIGFCRATRGGGQSHEQARGLRKQVSMRPFRAARRHSADDAAHRGGFAALGVRAAWRAARGVSRCRRRPRQPGRDPDRHRRRVLRAARHPRHLVLSDPPAGRPHRPHPLGGPASVDAAARNRGAGDQRDQRPGLAPFRDPAAVRHRARGGHGAVPGFGAFPVGGRARRRHAYRNAAAAGAQPRALLPADRADARCAAGASNSALSPRFCRPTG